MDVRMLQRCGLLAPCVSGSSGWCRAGKSAGNIGTRAGPDVLWFLYATDSPPDEQRVRLEYTACTYRGFRPWFACPSCRRRAAVLYMRSGRFRCLRCARVAYASQSEGDIGRSLRKQEKAEARMRRKGIHRATFDRLVSTIVECEERRERAASAFLARM
ncbi:hypothetical protein LJR130_003044 [Variovorax sp. LjRoot130]|uniref:hypothetical protein n=1 Tax=Variovorax sp. LjRoot130 TaxID=3342261 RepID=UPI003ED1208E